MKLRDAILLSLAVAFLIIGIHQIMIVGFGRAYWAIMLSLISFFAHNLFKSREGQKQTKGQSQKKVKDSSKAKPSKNSRQ